MPGTAITEQKKNNYESSCNTYPQCHHCWVSNERPPKREQYRHQLNKSKLSTVKPILPKNAMTPAKLIHTSLLLQQSANYFLHDSLLYHQMGASCSKNEIVTNCCFVDKWLKLEFNLWYSFYDFWIAFETMSKMESLCIYFSFLQVHFQLQTIVWALNNGCVSAYNTVVLVHEK